MFEEREVEHKVLEASESEPSLSECAQGWHERTPGWRENGFNFPERFKPAVDSMFEF